MPEDDTQHPGFPEPSAQQLTASELDALFEHVPIGMILVDNNRRVLRVNRAALAAGVHSPREAVGMAPGEAIGCLHALDDPNGCGHGPACRTCELRELASETIETGTAHLRHEVRLEFYSPGGVIEKHLLVSAQRISPSITNRILVCLEDITERRRAEHDLRESEAFRNIVQSSPLGMHLYRLEPDGRLVFYGANQAADRILGVDTRSFVGKTIEETFPPLRDTEVPERYRAAARDGTSWHTEQIVYRDGRIQGVFEIHAFRTSPGRMAAMFSDSTERTRAQEWLRLQRDLAVALSAVATLDDALPLCLDAALCVPGMDAGGIYLYDQTAGGLSLACSCGLSAAFVRSVSEYDADSPNAALVARAQPIYDVFPEITVPFDGAQQAEGLRAVAMIPMLHEGKVIGALNVASHARDEIPATARGILEGIAAQIAGVVSRLQAEDALRESEERFRALFEHAPDPIYMLDLDGRFHDGNRATEKLTGYLRKEFVGKTIFELGLIAVADAEKVAARLRESAAGHPAGPHEYPMTRKDGRQMIIETRAFAPNLGPQNVVMGIARDITDRKQAEGLLRRERDFNRTLIDASPAFIVGVSVEGKTLMMNWAMLQALGYSSEEAVGTDHLSTFIPERHHAAIADAHRNYATLRQKRLSEHGVLMRDGRELLVEWHSTPVFKADGELDFFLGVGIDITERRRSEEALRISEERFRGIAERSFDLIFTIDLQGNITYVSPASEIIVGLKPEEVVGRNFMDFLTESDVPRARRLFADRIAGKDIGAVEFSLKPRAGGAAFIEINSSPIVAEGRLVGIQGIIRDVTGRRRAEDTMRRMQDQLAHVSRLSTMGEMVAGIAHELNQPLYSILNFSKACRNVLSAGKRPDLEQLRDWTEEIASAAARAGAIVTQLRGFARRSESVRLVVSLNEIVEESVQLVASEAQRHRVAVRLEMAGQPAVVKADRIQIQQVMVNLLRNAYEAMEDGGAARRQATIRTELAGDAVEVSVADTGPGLPADPALEIFDAFVTTKPEGLGMGLAISTTIVESHGGRIWAGANPEGGATFRFTLPLANEERADGE